MKEKVKDAMLIIVGTIMIPILYICWQIAARVMMLALVVMAPFVLMMRLISWIHGGIRAGDWSTKEDRSWRYGR